MKRKTKAILLLTGIMVGCVIVGGLVGVANETSWDHALGRDKVAGEQASINFDDTFAKTTPVVDGKTVTATFLSSGTPYSVDFELNSTVDVASTSNLNMFELSNFNKATYVISGYTGYIDSIEIGSLVGTIKDEAKVKVYVGNKWLGTEKIGKVADNYTFDFPWLVSGDIKIVIDNADEENVVDFENILINPEE